MPTSKAAYYTVVQYGRSSKYFWGRSDSPQFALHRDVLRRIAMATNPKLRPLDFQPVSYQGQQMWFLRDPLQLSRIQLFFPAPMIQLLGFLDGTRTPQDVHAAFCRHVGANLAFDIVADALAKLDEACLLDNKHSQQLKEEHLQTYRDQPYRQPALADLGYPAQPEKLTELLKGYAGADCQEEWKPWRGRGIISPHIDYDRGGPVYSQVWRRAATAVSEADLVLIFGTDHNGGPGTITLTRLPYATPYGVMPTDQKLIDKLAESIGPDAAFADELHHKQEHSIELSAVWLHHICDQAGVAPPPMVPILVGSFQHFVMNGAHPAADTRLAAIIETLQQETTGRRVLAVASVDLAHVGPSFGDMFQMEQHRRSDLKMQDQALMSAAAAADAQTWYQQIATVQDRNRICGFAPTYLLLRYLGPTSGQQIAYDQCPADPQNNSLVSICGLLLK
jgi:AmmeMemoRadiSam system protein B